MHDIALTQKHIVLPVRRLCDEPGAAERTARSTGAGTTPSRATSACCPRDGEAEGHALVQGPAAVHDAHLQRRTTRATRWSSYAPFFDGNFFPFFPTSTARPFQPRAGARRSSARSRSTCQFEERRLDRGDPLADRRCRTSARSIRACSASRRAISIPASATPTRRSMTSVRPASRRAPAQQLRPLRSARPASCDKYFAGPTHRSRRKSLSCRARAEAEGRGLPDRDSQQLCRSAVRARDRRRPAPGAKATSRG